MIQARIIPLLLFSKEGLWKGVGFRNHTYVGDALNAIRIFNSREADELFFIDIDARAEGRAIRPELVAHIAKECFMPLSVGGGIASVKDAQEALNAGAEKVIVNSQAVRNPALVGELAGKFGSQCVVVALDIQRQTDGRAELYIDNGKTPTGRDPATLALEMAKAGAGEILITSIERDGTGQGYDLDLLSRISAQLSIHVLAGGGAGKLEHLAQAVQQGGARAAVAGSLFVFQGRRRAVLINFPSRTERERLLSISPEI